MALISESIASFAKISENSEDIQIPRRGSLPPPPSNPGVYEEINTLHTIKSGDEQRIYVRMQYDDVREIIEAAGKDLESFISCVRYSPEKEERFPPLGARSWEELTMTPFQLALYPTNKRFPGEWAHGFELCNEIRVDYVD